MLHQKCKIHSVGKVVIIQGMLNLITWVQRKPCWSIVRKPGRATLFCQIPSKRYHNLSCFTTVEWLGISSRDFISGTVSLILVDLWCPQRNANWNNILTWTLIKILIVVYMDWIISGTCYTVLDFCMSIPLCKCRLKHFFDYCFWLMTKML